MRENYRDRWDEIHKKYLEDNITYDNYLDKYLDLFDSDTRVLDLGCGLGNDSLYLSERNIKVTACDYSEVALNYVREKIENIDTRIVDLNEKLPFEDSSYDVVICDLSLHYFDDETTFRIIEEIKRVLVKDGYLIARVNSINDVNYGSDKVSKLITVDGYLKRFFAEEDVIRFFSVLGEVNYKETILDRYQKSKKVFEISVRNNK